MAGHLTVFVTRTRGPFWSIWPARVLLLAVIGIQVAATLIAVNGLLMPPIGWTLALLGWAYALSWFFLNDGKSSWWRLSFPDRAPSNRPINQRLHLQADRGGSFGSSAQVSNRQGWQRRVTSRVDPEMTAVPSRKLGHHRKASLLADPAGAGGRMLFVDALRVVVIGWVIAHHAAQPYGPTGGEWPVADPGNAEWLRPLYPLGAAFGLGLLFLLAGYFVPKAYDRKGAARFLKERWLRIGLPLMVFVLVVHVPVVYLIESPRPLFGEFVRSLYDSGWLNAYLHLWFLGHLVLYSVGYVLWRALIDHRRERPPRTWPLPGHAAVAGFVVVLALVTWVVRGWYPIDEWVPLFFVVAAEPAHLPQYVSLFALGIVAYRGDWLRRWSTRFGAIWLGIGLVTSAAVYVAVMLAEDPANDVIEGGGFTWQALRWSILEALICAGMVVGLIVVARAMFRRPSRVLSSMAAASYAAYILHVTFVLGLQAGLEGVDMSASLKFGIVAILGVILAFGTGHLSRRVPGLRAVLGTTPPAAVGRRGDGEQQ